VGDAGGPESLHCTSLTILIEESRPHLFKVKLRARDFLVKIEHGTSNEQEMNGGNPHRSRRSSADNGSLDADNPLPEVQSKDPQVRNWPMSKTINSDQFSEGIDEWV
jgi:hypothetical protein